MLGAIGNDLLFGKPVGKRQRKAGKPVIQYLLEILSFQAGWRRFAHRLFVRLCPIWGDLVRNVDV